MLLCLPDIYMPGASLLTCIPFAYVQAIRAGRFSLGSCSGETDVYTIWPESLTQRMALLPPPRCLASAVSPSVYDAPVRRAAVAVLHVPALPALKVWDAAVTTAAVGVLCGVAQREARAHGGYLVSITVGKARGVSVCAGLEERKSCTQCHARERKPLTLQHLCVCCRCSLQPMNGRCRRFPAACSGQWGWCRWNL